ncbi:MAG: hypothetical protein ACNA7G_09415 [Methylobacter sp.]
MVIGFFEVVVLALAALVVAPVFLLLANFDVVAVCLLFGLTAVTVFFLLTVLVFFVWVAVA